MSDKMLITQALDERDLLIKKISDKIAKADFVDTIKANEEKSYNTHATREEFAQSAESAYQQIMDLIARYEAIDRAIVASNANTTIETSFGTFTVAGAIAMRNRLKGNGAVRFEQQLQLKFMEAYRNAATATEMKNKNLQETAEDMRISILGRDTKNKDDKPLAVVDAYIKENTVEILDPINVVKKSEELKEKVDALISELDTQIKVSNATTFVEV